MRLETTATPAAADLASVRERLEQWNVVVTGRADWWDCAVYLRDDEDAIRGGALGAVWAGWLHVSILWVDDALRGRGFGRRLLEMLEADARARGVSHVHLDTFSFQAGPRFYERLGYAVFGRLPDHPPGHTHYFLTKAL